MNGSRVFFSTIRHDEFKGNTLSDNLLGQCCQFLEFRRYLFSVPFVFWVAVLNYQSIRTEMPNCFFQNGS